MSEIMDNGTSWQAVCVFCLCDSGVLCALHDQLASLGRHTQLMRCFSAVAELLVCDSDLFTASADCNGTDREGRCGSRDSATAETSACRLQGHGPETDAAAKERREHFV